MTETSNGKRDFFVSFNRADQAWAAWIAWTLEEAGYSVWYQHWDFAGNFVRDMDRAHEGSRRTVAVLSPDYLTSRFTAPEWAARFAEDATSAHDLLVPVRVQPCELKGLLAQIVYEDLVGCSEEEARQKLLARVGGLRRKPAEPPPFPSPRHETVTEKPPFPVPDHDLPRAAGPFVGRADELAALGQALAKSGSTAITQPHAVTGLGGVGKSTLALRYAYAHLADYDLVRWLPAEEPATLAAAYAGLAAPLGLDPATPDQPALINAIRARLERTPRWLLVFDNATDPASLDPYVPRVGSGHVLVTSRRRDWGEAAGTLELDVLPEEEAVALLLGDAPADAAARAQAAALAAELGRLPLALAQSRAFMRARRLDVAAYRHQLAAARPKVLAWRPEASSQPSTPDRAYTLPVAQVWQVSVEAAAKDCPAARDLLELLAFLAPEPFPRDLIGADPEVVPEGLREPFDRDNAIEALVRFSLLRADSAFVTIHRLVQAATLDALSAERAASHSAYAVRLMHAIWLHNDWNDPDLWPALTLLLPHAVAAAEGAESKAVELLAAIIHRGE